MLAGLLLSLALAPGAAQAPLEAAFLEARSLAVAHRQSAGKRRRRAPRALYAHPDDGRPRLQDAQLAGGLHHSRHAELFGAGTPGHNLWVLRGVDAAQATAPDGGGYFTGPRATPPESPIGYALSLFGRPLFAPRRRTSFCTGASYAALIEGLDRLYAAAPPPLSAERLEALQMEEPGGARREDGVKFWGTWNADDMGAFYALAGYAGMGRAVAPAEARPGDFMALRWKDGGSHSTVFLGWRVAKKKRFVLVWSSQESTDGMGDYLVPIERVAAVKVVRLTEPSGLFSFDPARVVERVPAWDAHGWD